MKCYLLPSSQLYYNFISMYIPKLDPTLVTIMKAFFNQASKYKTAF